MFDQRQVESDLKAVEGWNTAWMAKDLEGMKAIAAEDYIQWHCTIRKEFSKAEEFAMLEDAVKMMDIVFHHMTHIPLEGGRVLQQCLADIKVSNGGQVKDVPFAMVFRVRDGKIIRCDEYMNSLALPQLDFVPQT